MDTISGQTVAKDLSYINNFQQKFEDTAVFAELTYDVTDTWQVTGGMRAFWQDFSNKQQNGAFFTARSLLALDLDPSLAVRSIEANTTVNDVIFKFNTSLDVGENSKLYATWSEGFRRGGANGLPPVIFDFGLFDVLNVNPDLFNYTPDKVTNYEVGLKGRISGLSYTLSAFYIDWEDFQINESVTSNALSAVINGGDAKSKGIEFEINGNLTPNLNVMASYTYTKSHVSKYSELLVDEVLFGADPDDTSVQMPGTPEHSASWAAIYTHDLDSGDQLAFDVVGSYSSSVTTSIFPGASRAINDYAFFNFGATYSAELWDLRLYVDNAFNQRAVYSSEGVRTESVIGNQLANFWISRPRTIGLGFTYHFGA